MGKELNFKIKDRVKRADGTGCEGVIEIIKEEATKSQHETEMDTLMFKILWDNGTFSYFAPSALIKA